MASMLNISAIVIWLVLVQIEVKEIKSVTDSSLLLGPYAEMAYSFVVFPLIKYHLKSAIDTLKKLKAREEFLDYNF